MKINFNLFNINELNPKTDFDRNIISFIKNWLEPTKTASVQTSGSTGTPKIFEIEKEKMRNSAKMTCDFLQLKKEDKALICLPIEYISGKMMVIRAMEQKMQLITKEPSTAPLQGLNEKIDFCAMTPLQVENSLEKIHLIKNLIIGGAAVSESLKSKIKANIQNPNSKIYETYGMSETLSHVALKEIYPKTQDFFTVLDGVEISTDERGCLKIFAPKLNLEVLQTNDLVELSGDKQFRFLGRTDNIINSAGAKIFPEELENLIKKYISNEVVFLGLKDETLGQKLVLIIEGNESDEILTKIRNINFEKTFHKPKNIIFTKQIPRTPNGKVDRENLLDLIVKNH
ncbi:MAG: AMP-binding protein [Cruoricaptor ignavus]|nr:AMP-binding protein [Cruoricaptor ignavus]